MRCLRERLLSIAPKQCSEFKPLAKLGRSLQTLPECAGATRGVSNTSNPSPPQAYHLVQVAPTAPPSNVLAWYPTKKFLLPKLRLIVSTILTCTELHCILWEDFEICRSRESSSHDNRSTWTCPNTSQ